MNISDTVTIKQFSIFIVVGACSFGALLLHEYLHANYPDAVITDNLLMLFFTVVIALGATNYHKSHLISQQLVQRDERLKQLFEQSSDCILLLTQELDVIDCNQKSCQILEYTKEELLKLNVKDFDKTENPAKLQVTMLEQLKELPYISLSTTITRKSSTTFDGEIHLSNFSLQNENLILANFWDISEKKNFENQLERSEKRFRLLAETSSSWIYWRLPDGSLDYCSPACQEIVGYSASDFYDNPQLIDLIIHAADRDAWNNHRAPDTFTGAATPIRFRVIHKEGEVRWMEHTCTPIYDDEKNFLGMQSRNYDITAKMEREKEIVCLQAGIEQSPVLIEITDINGHIEYVNPQFCEVTGYTKAEVMGKNPNILQSTNKTDYDYTLLWKTIKEGKIWKGEFKNLKKDKTEYWESALISPIKDSEGNIINFIAIKEDITERKEMEVLLEQAKDAAESADRIKSQFLSIMSHELLTPMNGILGMVELLKEEELSETQHEFTSVIEDSARQLLNLINEILEFTEIEIKPYALKEGPIYLSDLFDTALNYVDRDIKQKNLSIDRKIDRIDFADYFIGDSPLFEHVLKNLLNNAVKFTNCGSIGISCVAEPVNREIAKLIFKISDTGTGINKEVLPHIFEMFTQGDSSVTRAHGGTGIGLAITKVLVEKANGSLAVESTVGKGSTFTVSLPVKFIKD